jgi:hypothetical protein
VFAAAQPSSLVQLDPISAKLLRVIKSFLTAAASLNSTATWRATRAPLASHHSQQDEMSSRVGSEERINCEWNWRPRVLG